MERPMLDPRRKERQIGRAACHEASALYDSPGTYALLMRSRGVDTVSVGSLGNMRIEPGAYLYVGSAFGPGGLRARLARHAARTKVARWHVDYARPRMSLVCAWFSTSNARFEHDWAARALALPTARIPLSGFGASDCNCVTHLIRFPDSASSRRSIGMSLAASGAEPFGKLEAGLLRGLPRIKPH
jgi:Uri superfamily endonuclease